MAEQKPDVGRETPEPHPRWKDDPYGGIDVTVMQMLLKMTPAERFRYSVDASNFVSSVRGRARKQ